MEKLEELWRVFNSQHIQLQQGREMLADTNYNKTNENTKLLYEDMKSNIRFLLRIANLQTFNDIFGNASNAPSEQGNTPNQNADELENVFEVSSGAESNAKESSESEFDKANESFKTVKKMLN